MGPAVSILPRTKRLVALVVLISAALGGAAMAQRGFGFAGIRYPFQALPNANTTDVSRSFASATRPRPAAIGIAACPRGPTATPCQSATS